jgi:cytochrome P450
MNPTKTLTVAEGPSISIAAMLLARLQRQSLPSPLDIVLQAAKAGDVARWRIGPRSVYQVNAPSLVSEVLVERADEFPRTKHLSTALEPIFGRGLLISDGEVHRSERRRLFSAFAPEAMKSNFKEVVSITRWWLDSLKSGEEYDIERQLQILTLRIGARVMLGAAGEAEMEHFGSALFALVPYAQRAVRSIVHLPAWLPTKAFRRRKSLIAQADASLARIVAAPRTPQEQPDALDLLLHGRSVADKLVRDGMFSLLAASQEGTAATLSFMLYLLATHKEEASELESEIDRVFSGNDPDYEDLSTLSAMENQLKEAWRLYPPSWITTRSPSQETSLGEYKIPKGTMIAVSPYALHRDARWFEQPETFRPSRWTSEFERGLSRGAWLPFGVGPHSCIGRTLGLLETRVILAMLVQRYRVELVGEAPLLLSAGITLRPRRLRLRLQSRSTFI